MKSNVILAPMAGITNLAYREFAKPFGVGLSYSEMVSDCGLIYQNKETYKYLATSLKDRPVAIQLFGGKKETILEALEIIKSQNIDFDFLDLNLGCPVPKVTKTGAGSSWLTKLDDLEEMATAVVKVSPKPVLAKIRIGWDNNSINVKETVLRLQKAGISMIAIHPRTRNQLYQGAAQYEVIKDIKDIMTVPLAISGDIYTLDDAIRFQEMTKADAVMVARGALGNPFLITQIDHYFKTGEKLPSPTLAENVSFLIKHFELLISLKGEDAAVREMRGIAPHYLKGYPGTKVLKNELSTQMQSKEDFYRIIKPLL